MTPRCQEGEIRDCNAREENTRSREKRKEGKKEERAKSTWIMTLS